MMLELPEAIVEKLPHGSGAPFGALIFLFLLLYIVTQLVKLFMPRHRNRRTLVKALVPLGLIFVFSIASLLREDADWNPSFVETDIVGNWEFRGSTLNLRQDGTYEADITNDFARQLKIGTGSGVWVKPNQSSSFDIVLTSKDGKISESLRVIKWKDRYRIILADFDDPDGWHGNYGFKRITMK